MAGWILNTWVGAPALTRVFGEFLCGAALCRSVALSHGARGVEGDILGGGAFAAFLFGASTGFGDFALVALLAVTILGTAMSRGSWARTLGSRPLLWLGEVSYSIYIVHFPVLIIIRRFGRGWDLPDGGRRERSPPSWPRTCWSSRSKPCCSILSSVRCELAGAIGWAASSEPDCTPLTLSPGSRVP